jgi:hypothetical protein
MPESTPRPDPPETVRKGNKWCPRCGTVKKHDAFRHEQGQQGWPVLDLQGVRGRRSQASSRVRKVAVA